MDLHPDVPAQELLQWWKEQEQSGGAATGVCV